MRAAVMKMPCSQKWVMGVLVLMVGMDWAAGSRLLKETQQSFSSASVSGGPGGQAQVSFSGSEGTFSQTFTGEGGLQFSTENGGTVTFQGADGVPQTFTSVLGPAGAPLPPPIANPASLPTVESISRSIPTINLPGTNDDFAAQVRAQIQAFFNQYYRSFKPPGAIAGPAAGAAVGAIVAQPSTVVPRAAVAAAPQGPVITQQNTGSGQRVSASVTAPGSTSLNLSSTVTSG